VLSLLANTKHRTGGDGNTGSTGTVAQSDKSTMHTDSSHSITIITVM